jgi:cysteine desulfurase
MIYLDNNATTRPLDEVVGVVARVSREQYVNPSSTAGDVIGAIRPRYEAATAMARLLNAEGADRLVFTSGATESNNWVLGPIARSCAARTIIVSAIEHASVAEPARLLEKEGFCVRVAPVDSQGVIRLDALAHLLSDDVAIVSVMAANNETGALQPIDGVGRVVRSCAPAALFHTDATQAVGKMLVDLQGEFREVDLLSFSAHKFHGPRGIGGLYVRTGVAIPAMLHGGGQEASLRAGTINTPGLAGLAAAAHLVDTANFNVVRGLRDRFELALREVFASVIVHSAQTLRLPNTSCFSVPGVIASDVVEALARQNIVVGNGSACSAGAMHPPKTLLAMAVPYDLATSALRVSLAPSTNWWELHTFIGALADVLCMTIQERNALSTS